MPLLNRLELVQVGPEPEPLTSPRKPEVASVVCVGSEPWDLGCEEGKQEGKRLQNSHHALQYVKPGMVTA